jgi:large subunit ribosomal protein L35
MAKGHKPRKAAVKRIKVTGSGKLRRRKAGLTHLQSKRSSKTQMRNGDGAMGVSDTNVHATKRLLGIG